MYAIMKDLYFYCLFIPRTPQRFANDYTLLLFIHTFHPPIFIYNAPTQVPFLTYTTTVVPYQLIFVPREKIQLVTKEPQNVPVKVVNKFTKVYPVCLYKY